MSNKVYLGDGCVYELSPQKTGINANGIIVGSSGSGKTTSFTEPFAINNDEVSMIIPVSKPSIIKECAPALVDHGYKIEIIDFAGDLSTVGYNPLGHLKTELDYRDFGDAVMASDNDQNNGQFWRNSAINQLTVFLSMLNLNAEYKGDNSTPTLRDLKTLYREFNISGSFASSRMSSSLDSYFEAACNEYPDSITALSWTAFSNNQANVAKDINSTLYASIQKLFVDEVIRLSEDYEPFNFRRLGLEKIALFIVTSPTKRFIDDYINTMYRFAIAELMDEAQKYPDARLPVPVHMIFDDFACGTQIKNFDSYISVFRQAGISAMLLLQSESQLFATYGESQATTIIDNCDSYVYLGGNDVRSAERVAKRLNKPLHKVMELPLGEVVVMRRGAPPVVTTRYRTYEDPNYIKYAEGGQRDVIR